MKRSGLLAHWPLLRSSGDSWLVYLAQSPSDQRVVKAVARAVVCHSDVPGAVRELLALGEYEAAELLLLDSQGGLEADGLRLLETALGQAQAASLAELRSKVAELESRAQRAGQPLDGPGLIAELGRSRTRDQQRLEAVERAVDSWEKERLALLLKRLDGVTGEGPTIEHWRATVAHALEVGALDAAEAALLRGPSSDVSSVLLVPQPPIWPFKQEPLARVVSWFFREGVIPPGFERFRPDQSQSAAWEFLGALREEGPPDTILTAAAGVFGSSVLRVESSSIGVTAFFDDLSAPGLHALGCRRWPGGVPVFLSASPESPDPREAGQGVLIRLLESEQVGLRNERVLHVTFGDLLAVLAEDNARSRLLALLGRQLPLDLAFDARLADLSVQWKRTDLPDLVDPVRPRLLIGAPGQGKSTLLMELARDTGGAVVSAADATELPTVGTILVDSVEALDEDRLRRLVREVHWVRTTRDPTPAVVVATRPESVPLFERTAGDMFERYTLAPRSLGALRDQASTMLGWLGMAAVSLASFDRLSHLAGGNPTVLFLLCRALALEVAAKDRRARRFGPMDVEAAWASEELRAAIRRLLWTPISAVAGVPETLRSVIDYVDPGLAISRDDLVWAVGEQGADRSEDRVQDCVDLLVGYGLLELVDEGVRVSLGGPGLLARRWVGPGSSEEDSPDPGHPHPAVGST